MIPFLTGVLVGAATWALFTVVASLVGWLVLIVGLALAAVLWGYIVMDGAPEA